MPADHTHSTTQAGLDRLVRRLARRRIALVHDWLLGMRGGEWVLDNLLALLPQASVYTLFYNPDGVTPSINRHGIHPSALNRLPGVGRYYRMLLPLMPRAIRRMSIAPETELVLATSHCVAHGAKAPAGAAQVNYYFSPMRYLYDQNEAYRSQNGLACRALDWIAPRLKQWDRDAAARADHVWAISRFVAERIERAYGRKARVIYPPVRTRLFTPPDEPRRNGEYLLVSAMVPYKRVDLAIRVANRLALSLRVVGDGPLLERMRRLAGPSVRFEGRISQERLIHLYRTRRGLIFPGEEDFGLTPLEAMACGMPVLGLRAGGLRETLHRGVCGEFFDLPTSDSLAGVWSEFEPEKYAVAALRAQAERFGEQPFAEAVLRALAGVLGETENEET